jgi:hypothetical protein
LKTKAEEANITHLVSHNEDVLLSFKLHYHRFQSDNNVTVRFAPYIILPVKIWHLTPKAAQRTTIPIIKLVIVSVGKVFWVRQLHVRGDSDGGITHSMSKLSKISYLDFLVRHPVANARIEFIQ